jgi:hypothetical protein
MQASASEVEELLSINQKQHAQLAAAKKVGACGSCGSSRELGGVEWSELLFAQAENAS